MKTAEEASMRNAEVLHVVEATSIPAQLIIGSVTGVLSGFLDKVAGRGWAVAVGAGLVALRLAGHMANRSSPCSLCGVRPEDLNFIEHFVNEAVIFLNRNLFVATGYLGGYMAAYQISGSSDS